VILSVVSAHPTPSSLALLLADPGALRPRAMSFASRSRRKPFSGTIHAVAPPLPRRGSGPDLAGYRLDSGAPQRSLDAGPGLRAGRGGWWFENLPGRERPFPGLRGHVGFPGERPEIPGGRSGGRWSGRSEG